MRYINRDGGAGSGNWGHAGRPGQRGGSASIAVGVTPEGKEIRRGISSDKDKDGKPKLSGKAYRLATPEGGWTGLIGAYKENAGKAAKKAAATEKTGGLTKSFKDAAREMNEKLKAEKRRPTMEECKEVGKLLVKEFETFHGATKELSEQFEKSKNEVQDLVKKYNKTHSYEVYKEYKAKYDEFVDLKKKLDDAGKIDTEWLKNKLSEIRHIGIKGDVGEVIALKGKKPNKAEQTVVDALSGYPTSWIEAAKAAGGNMLTVKSIKGRSYYSPVKNGIFVDGEHSSAVHEVVHWFERKTGRVSKAEKVFYEDRTKGEVPVSLKKLTGGGYKATETARTDKFIDAYMGKDYGGHAFELLSMGCEYAFTQPHVLAKDPDMQAWVFGCLACL